MSLLSIFLFSLRVDARSNSGYNQISFNQHEIAYAPFSQVPWYATVNVGMSADKNNIYTAIDMGPWYQGTSFFRGGINMIIMIIMMVINLRLTINRFS